MDGGDYDDNFQVMVPAVNTPAGTRDYVKAQLNLTTMFRKEMNSLTNKP
jgi:hypothetical protein